MPFFVPPKGRKPRGPFGANAPQRGAQPLRAPLGPLCFRPFGGTKKPKGPPLCFCPLGGLPLWGNNVTRSVAPKGQALRFLGKAKDRLCFLLALSALRPSGVTKKPIPLLSCKARRNISPFGARANICPKGHLAIYCRKAAVQDWCYPAKRDTNLWHILGNDDRALWGNDSRCPPEERRTKKRSEERVTSLPQRGNNNICPEGLRVPQRGSRNICPKGLWPALRFQTEKPIRHKGGPFV